MNPLEKEINDSIIEYMESLRAYKEGYLGELERYKEDAIFEVASELCDRYQMDKNLLENECDKQLMDGFKLIVSEIVDWNYIDIKIEEDYQLASEDYE